MDSVFGVGARYAIQQSMYNSEQASYAMTSEELKELKRKNQNLIKNE